MNFKIGDSIKINSNIFVITNIDNENYCYNITWIDEGIVKNLEYSVPFVIFEKFEKYSKEPEYCFHGGEGIKRLEKVLLKKYNIEK